VLIEEWGTPGFLRNFDLKTFQGARRAISPRRQLEFQRRFGVFAEEMYVPQ
jgi:hypothetical protein